MGQNKKNGSLSLVMFTATLGIQAANQQGLPIHKLTYVPLTITLSSQIPPQENPLNIYESRLPKMCEFAHLDESLSLKAYKITKIQSREAQICKPRNLQTYKPEKIQTHQSTGLQISKFRAYESAAYRQCCKPTNSQIYKSANALLKLHICTPRNLSLLNFLHEHIEKSSNLLSYKCASLQIHNVISGRRLEPTAWAGAHQPPKNIF